MLNHSPCANNHQCLYLLSINQFPTINSLLNYTLVNLGEPIRRTSNVGRGEDDRSEQIVNGDDFRRSEFFLQLR